MLGPGSVLYLFNVVHFELQKRGRPAGANLTVPADRVEESVKWHGGHV